MHWFCKSFLGAAMVSLGTAVGAQEPNPRPMFIPVAAEARPDASTSTVPKSSSGVSLGKPIPLGGSGPGNHVVNAFQPIREEPSDTGIRQTGYQQQPPPTVVRASSGSLADEPNSFILPKDFPPMMQSNFPSTMLPAVPLTPIPSAQEITPVQTTQPVPPKDKAKIIEVEKNLGFGYPQFVDNGIPTFYHEDPRIIITDENGNPLDTGDTEKRYRWYGDAEAILWWSRGFHLPPLVTTASPFDPIGTRGAIGFGTTQVIYGNSDTSSQAVPGGRFTIGHTLDSCGICSLEATVFFLGRKNDVFTANSDQFPVIARPFYDLNTGQQSREITTTPGLLATDGLAATGSIRVASTSELWGGEVNLRSKLWCGCNYTITGLLGFRYLDLHEDLNITENSLVVSAVPGIPVMVGSRTEVFDDFATRNRFFGGQTGISGEWLNGRWSLDARMKIALGVTSETVDINGGQTILSPNGSVQHFVGGLYALPSNIGSHSQNRFAVVPETGLKLGYDLTPNIRVFVGYDALYWSSVLRPGDQIDQVLDVRQVPNSGPGPFPPTSQVRPIVPFHTSSYWAQGVSAGILIRY